MAAGAHFLRNVSLFANLSLTELEPLAQQLIARKYRAGEQIFHQGSPGNSMYIVKSGLVEIVVTDNEGGTQVLAQLGPGQFFGEFALLDGLPRSAGALARQRSELLILTRPQCFMYLEQHPSVATNLLVILSRRLRFALQRTEHDEVSDTPLARLAGILVQLADRYGFLEDHDVQLSIRLTQGELAGIMGFPRSDAEAAFETLRQQGLVDVRGLHITIHDLEALRGLASNM